MYSPERRNQVLDLQQKVEGGIEVWEIPGLWEMFDHPAEAYRCEKRYADVEDEPSVVIHSSGTTGEFCVCEITGPIIRYHGTEGNIN